MMRFFSWVLITTTCVLVRCDLNGRDQLLSLLETTIPNHGLESLMETATTSSRRRRRDPPPRRRHSPCECPNNSDATSNDCVKRRYYLLLNNEDAISATPDAQTGQTTASAALSLRVARQNLNETFLGATSRVQAINEGLMDPSNGTLAATSSALKTLLNEEALMALSANNAWMSLINATTVAAADGNRVVAQIVNGTNSVTNWFNSLQASEEAVTVSNRQKVLAYINYGFSEVLTKINTAQNTVWRVLNGLSDNMGGSEDSASTLSDSLRDAADNLSDKLAEFAASFPDLGGSSEDILGRGLNQLINDFESQVQTAMSTVKSTAEGKRRIAVTAAEQSVLDQNAAFQSVLKQFKNETDVMVADTQMAHSRFQTAAQQGFDQVNSFLGEVAANTTLDITNRQAMRKGNLTMHSQKIAGIVSSIQTMASDDMRQSADAEASRLSYADAAANAVQASLSSFDARHADIVAGARTTADAAVDAVGTGTRSSLDHMGSQYDALQGSLAAQAQDAAVASMSTTTSLNQAALSGSTAMSQAGGALNAQMSSAFGGNLNTLVTLNSGTSADTKGVLAAGQAQLNQVAGASATAAASGADTAGLTAAAAAGASVNDMLSSLMGSGLSMTDSIAHITQLVQSSAANAAAVQQGISTTGASTPIADVALRIGDTSADFAAMMAKLMQSASLMQEGGNLVLAADTGSSELVNIGSPYVAGIATGGNDVISAATNMQSILDAASQSVSSAAGGSASAINSNLLKSSADIDKAMAEELGVASQSVGHQASIISSLQTASAVQLGQINTNQLDEIRAAAASIDSLMKQMNAFLGSQSGPLYDQVGQLPTQGQQLMIRMGVLSDMAASIANNTQLAYKLQNPAVLTDQLYSQLSQYSSNALSVLNTVITNFNTSASSYSNEFIAQVKNLATDFATASANLKIQLGSLSTTAAGASESLSASPEGKAVVDNLLSIHSELSGTFGTNSATLAKLNEAGVGGSPPTLPTLLSNIASVKEQAGVDAGRISAQLEELAKQAQSQVAAATEFQQTEGAPPMDEVVKAAAMARMNEGIAASKLAAQQAELTKLQKESGSTVKDLAASATLDAQAKANQADSVYDSVLKAKSGVSVSMGNILKSVSTTQSSQGAELASNDAANAINLQSMRNALNGLMNIFTTYMQTEKVQFARSVEDRAKFMTALAMEVKGNLTKVDNGIMAGNTAMSDKQSVIVDEEAGFENSGVDSSVARLNGLLDDWLSSQSTDVAKVQAQVTNLPQTNAFNYDKVSEKLNATEKSFAQNAVTIIQQFGKSVPAELAALAAR